MASNYLPQPLHNFKIIGIGESEIGLSRFFEKNTFIFYRRDPRLELIYKLGLGFVSGVLGSCFNIPFDVAKSRIQGPQPVPGVIKYRTTTITIVTIYNEEGWRALYKGLIPKVMRLGPGGAIMLVVYEHVHSYLTRVYNT